MKHYTCPCCGATSHKEGITIFYACGRVTKGNLILIQCPMEASK